MFPIHVDTVTLPKLLRHRPALDRRVVALSDATPKENFSGSVYRILFLPTRKRLL